MKCGKPYCACVGTCFAQHSPLDDNEQLPKGHTMKKHNERGSTKQYKCQCCGGVFTARTADRARGWARFCSKSCKAKKQEQRTHQSRDYWQRRESKHSGECFPSHAEGEVQ